MKRRDFIYLAPLLAGYPLLQKLDSLHTLTNPLLSPPKNLKKFLVSSYSSQGRIDVSQTRQLPPIPSEIVFLNLARNRVGRADVPFFGHHYFSHPVEPHIVATCEKWGRRAGAFDIKTKKVVKLFHPPRAARFFGHGFFLPDGKRIAFTANTNDDLQGLLLIYDWEVSELIAEYSTHGVFPHECVLAENGKSVIIANTRHDATSDVPGEIVELDLKNGQKLNAHNLAPFNAAHLHKVANKQYLFGSQYNDRLRFGVIDLKQDSVVEISSALKDHSISMHGESLSLGSLDEETFFSTTASGKTLIFWNPQKNLVYEHAFPQTTLGIVRVNEYLYLSLASNQIQRLKFDTKSFSVVENTQLQIPFANAPHLALVSF